VGSVIQVIAFGGIVCTIASVTLALTPSFQPERRGFGRRLWLFFWRFSLPAWAALELGTLLLTGRFYP
jgi:hypothetical protein